MDLPNCRWRSDFSRQVESEYISPKPARPTVQINMVGFDRFGQMQLDGEVPVWQKCGVDVLKVGQVIRYDDHMHEFCHIDVVTSNYLATVDFPSIDTRRSIRDSIGSHECAHRCSCSSDR